MARLLTLPLERVTDANGVLYPGALLDSFLTGTTTPTPTYTTSALSVAHANPIVANAGGLLPPIYLDPAVTYRFRARTSAGVNIAGMDFDPVTVASAADVSFTPAGSSVAIRTLQDRGRDLVSVKDKTIASSNIAPALAAVIADIGGSTGNLGFGEVYIPDGNYNLGATVLSTSQSLRIEGVGWPIITWTGPAGTGAIAAGAITSTSIMFRLQDYSRSSLSKLVLLGGGLTPDIAILSDDTNSTTVTSGQNDSLHIADVSIGRRWVQNSLTYANGFLYGIYFGGPNLVNNDLFTIERVAIHDCTGAGILIASNQSIWGDLTTVLLDTCGYGIDTRSNTQGRNLQFNRNKIADFRCRDGTIHDIIGFNAENSFKLIDQSLNASVRVNGGKALLTNSVVHNGVTVVMGPYWATFAATKDIHFENWWVDIGTATGRRLKVSASSGQRGRIYIRHCRLPNGDSRDGYEFNVATAGAGLSFDIEEGAFKAKGTLEGSTQFDPTSLADGASVLQSFSISANAGVSEGDPVIPALQADLGGMMLFGNCYDNNLLYARLNNESGGVVDLGSMAGTVSISAGGTTLTGVGTDFTLLAPGQEIAITDTAETLVVGVIASATSLTVQTAAGSLAAGSAFRRERKLRWRKIADSEIKARGSATFDGANLADGAGETTTVSCVCELGDFVYWGYTSDLRVSSNSAYVSTANTVAVRLQNEGGSATNPASGTLNVYAIMESAFDFMGAKVYDPPSLADGAGDTIPVSVPGVRIGDFCLASFSLDLQGITHSVYVSANDIATVRLQNETGGVLDLAAMQIRVGAFIALG